MHVFIATIGTETNTFSSIPTGLSSFRNRLWLRGGVEAAQTNPWTAPAQIWCARAREAGWKITEGLHTFSEPAGVTQRAAWEEMRDLILDDLRAAGPVDAVLMFMHGAMVADGYDDCEADLAGRIRQIIGPEAVFGLELDLHANLDQPLLDATDLIVFYKTYPHIDHAERAEDVFRLTQQTLAGQIRPQMALFDCRAIGLFPTTMAGPMPQFMDDMVAAEGRDGVLSLSLNHGFPWADVPIAGAKMLAVTDGDTALAQHLARSWGERFYRIRQAALLPFTPFDEAIRLASTTSGDKPLLLADTSDQVGSGAPGDTTYVLRALIEAGVTSAAIAPFYDPAAIETCFQLGVSGTARLRIGGKLDPNSGPPLDAEIEVIFLKRGAWQEHIGDERIAIGDVATIRVAGIEIVLTSLRTNLYSTSLFTLHGVDFASKQVLSIKNLYKHKDLFEPLVREQHFVATPGCSDPVWSRLPFRRLVRPIWPLDPDPLGLDGAGI